MLASAIHLVVLLNQSVSGPHIALTWVPWSLGENRRVTRDPWTHKNRLCSPDISQSSILSASLLLNAIVHMIWIRENKRFSLKTPAKNSPRESEKPERCQQTGGEAQECLQDPPLDCYSRHFAALVKVDRTTEGARGVY